MPITQFFLFIFLPISSQCPPPTLMVYKSMANVPHPHFFIHFFTTPGPMPPTHIFVFTLMLFYQSMANNSHHSLFFISFLKSMANPHHPHSWYFANIWPMSPYFIHFLPIYSQSPPPTFLYLPQPPHHTIVPTHFYPPGVASPFMHLVGFWPSWLHRQPPALQRLRLAHL